MRAMSEANPSATAQRPRRICTVCGQPAEVSLTKIEKGQVAILHLCLKHAYRAVPDYEDLSEEEAARLWQAQQDRLIPPPYPDSADG